MDKTTLIKNFSRYAGTYDKYADAQKMAANELIQEISHNGFKDILELGCGTGNYTLLLRHKFSQARLKAVDISLKMLEVAAHKLKDGQIEFIACDAENMRLKEKFDLITSNACFQWFDDLDKALLAYSGMLNHGGMILFSIFGPETFRELRESLRIIFGKSSIAAAGFAGREQVKAALERNFNKIEVRRIMRREVFSRLKDLLDKIKYTGTKGSGLNGTVFTPALLKRSEEVYLKKFGRIIATYEIFLCQGRKI